MWVWMKEPSEDGSEGVSSVDPRRGVYWVDRGCTQMALGSHGELRRAPCSGRHAALCEKSASGETEV